jgi:hypothetical protein
MLAGEQSRGIEDALRHYGVKEAAAPWLQAAGNAIGKGGRFLFGHPDKLLSEGGKAFQPGGVFDAKNVFWPTMPGKPISTWMGRTFGTILPAYGMWRAAKGQDGDPHEGRLSNTLSSLGGAVGGAYGYSMGGILGAPYIQRAGASVGRNLGRMLGSRPPPPIEPTEDQIHQFLAQHQQNGGGY